MNTIRKVYGVINFVYWLGKPAIISAAEIQSIKEFLTAYCSVKIEQAPLNIQDEIKILNGSFIEMEGHIVAVKKKSVKVLLRSLRCYMTVEVEKENVDLVKKYNSSISRP